MSFFVWLEHSDFSMWVKDADTLFGYNVFLAAHAIGMALLVGFSVAVALRILGFAPTLPFAPMERWFPVMYIGFWINTISGIVLFMVYPTKALVNPGFYLKLGLILVAMVCIRRIRHELFGVRQYKDNEAITTRGRALSIGLLFSWTAAVMAGRLMAYHGVWAIEWQTPIAFAVLITIVGAGAYVVTRIRAALSKPAQVDVAVSIGAGRR